MAVRVSSFIVATQGLASADLVEKRLRAREQPGGRPCLSPEGKRVGDVAEVDCEPDGIAEFAPDRKALLEQCESVLDPALLNSDHGKRTEQRRLERFVPQQTHPAKVVLVQYAGALEVAGRMVGPAEGASRPPRIILVAGVEEALDALLQQLPRRRPIAVLVEYVTELLQGHSRAPGVAESAVNRQRLLGPELSRRIVARNERQLGRTVQSIGARRRGRLVGN